MKSNSDGYLSVLTPQGRSQYLRQYGAHALKWRLRTLKIRTGTGITLLLLVCAIIFFSSKKGTDGVINVVAVICIVGEAIALWWSRRSEAREIGVAYGVAIGHRKGQVPSRALFSPSVSRDAYLKWCHSYGLEPDPFDDDGLKVS
jgi:hypothetical protein